MSSCICLNKRTITDVYEKPPGYEKTSRTAFYCAPGGRTFYRVKVPTLPGSGKGIAEQQGCPPRGGI